MCRTDVCMLNTCILHTHIHTHIYIRILHTHIYTHTHTYIRTHQRRLPAPGGAHDGQNLPPGGHARDALENLAALERVPEPGLVNVGSKGWVGLYGGLVL